MSTISSGAFSTFKANNAHLYSSRRNSFNIHQNNGFINTESPKSSRWLSGQKLNSNQAEAIKAKIKAYTARENRNIAINAAVSLFVSAGIIVLSSQLLNNLL